MKYNYKKTIMGTLGLLALALSLNYASGPGSSVNGSNAVTGAPFNGGATCTNCHGGVSNYGATASMQLISGGNVATVYNPGWNYTLRITRSAPSVPPAGGFGFQVTSASTTAPLYTTVNTWGTPPAGTALRTISGRQYVEHTSKISNGTTQINIPWTGPAAGTGQVRFNLALNTVNGNGANSGDQVITATLTLNQAALPVSWLYFRGHISAGAAVLEWGTTNELSNGHFTIEKSLDGQNFQELNRVDATEGSGIENHYTYTDAATAANAYYRISQTDVSGEQTFFNTIQLRQDVEGINYHYMNGDEIIVNVNAAEASFVQVRIIGLDGKVITAAPVGLVPGFNSFPVSKPGLPGIYFLNVSNEKGTVYSSKLILP
ncbi:MAG: T9SS type A sorting domain-containing protein [Sphingobacteriales bacterium]|nr:MAG: T9SS type A sorting domain-containing protein [Sphingobacteriales bacterium]